MDGALKPLLCVFAIPAARYVLQQILRIECVCCKQESNYTIHLYLWTRNSSGSSNVPTAHRQLTFPTSPAEQNHNTARHQSLPNSNLIYLPLLAESDPPPAASSLCNTFPKLRSLTFPKYGHPASLSNLRVVRGSTPKPAPSFYRSNIDEEEGKG